MTATVYGTQNPGIHPSVQEATAAGLPSYTYSAGVITASSNGALTVDGVAVQANDRVLVKNETSANAPYNGIYVATNPGASGAPFVLTRAPDMATGAQVPGSLVLVEQGTANAGALWQVVSAGPFTLGTTSITWTQFTGSAGTVTSVFGRTGAVAATSGDYSVGEVTGAAPTASPALTGTPTAPTASALTDSTQLATTAYADAAVGVETSRAETAEALLAPKASPALTGTPTAPTAAALTDNTQVATTAYADAAVAAAAPSSGTPLALTKGGTGVSAASDAALLDDLGALDASENLADLGTRQTALNNLAGAVTSGDFLRGNGTNVSMSAIQAGDLPAATTSAQGAVELDGTAGDIAALGSQAAGSTGKAADAGHVHPTTGVVLTSSLPLGISSGGTGTATGAPQNDVFAGPSTGGTGAPSFRALVAGDLPAGTTSAKGALELDGTAGDIQMDGAQAAGSTGKAADSGHVHPTDTSRAQDTLTVHLAGTETVTGAKTFNLPPNLATQSVSSTATLSAASAPVVLTDTTSAAFTLTLPASPVTGEWFIVVDDTGQWATHNLTIGRNGKNIDGAAANLTLANQWGKVWLYYDGTAWWSLANGLSNETPVIDGSASAGSHNSAARADHIHPTDTSRLAATAAAGGDLSGNYPNPTVAKISGTAFSLPVSLANGGTGQASQQAAMDALAGAVTSGDYLRGNGSHVVMAAIAAGDLPAGTTSAQGALQLDGTAGDIQMNGSQAAGSKGQAADAEHVHPSDTSRLPLAGGTMTGWLAPAVVTLTDASTVSVNAASGNVFALSLTASGHTLGSPSSPVDGQKITVRVIQPSSGGPYTLSYNSVYDFGAAGSPTLSTGASKVDILGFEYVASLSKWCYLGSGLGF